MRVGKAGSTMGAMGNKGGERERVAAKIAGEELGEEVGMANEGATREEEDDDDEEEEEEDVGMASAEEDVLGPPF